MESCIEESLDNFLTDLETFEGDAWSDDRPDVLRIASDALHGMDCFADDALHGSSPSGVHGGSDAVANVVEEHGNAVGGGDPNADSGKGGDKGIGIG